jgi:branched-chain amino acid transport system permease protein
MHANAAGAPVHFKPHDAARRFVWTAFALLLLVAPLVFTSGMSHALMTQMAIGAIVCLSYNILLGQGGMLSFGHAVFSGFGSFLAIKALNAASAGLPLPVSLVPLVGGIAGALLAALFGSMATRRSGLTFAMITLGLAELVGALWLMLPEVFGGEGGLTADRVVGKPFLGVSYGPAIQVYYLVAVWCFVCTAAMFALTRTPLGRLLNAVRDNAERVGFIGYSAQHVRLLGFVIAGFFAGIGGGLAAISAEIVNVEVVGTARSGAYLLFTFLGGSTVFFGPLLGAVLMVLALTLFSEWTSAWLLYLGVLFVLMVMYAPGGLAALLLMNLRVAAHGLLRPLWPAYGALIGAGLVAMCGVSAMVEMIYHLQFGAGLGDPFDFLGVSLRADSADAWIGAAFTLVTGAGLFELARRRFAAEWDAVQHEIEATIRRKEGL